MPIALTKFLCGICATEYIDMETASACECLPPAHFTHVVGQNIEFQRETKLGTSYGYVYGDGPVLMRYTKLGHASGIPIHTPVYVVGLEHNEVEVTIGANGEFIATVERIYAKGYHIDRAVEFCTRNFINFDVKE